MSVRYIEIKRFQGIADSEKEGLKSQYLWGESIDYRTDPTKLTILPKTTKDSGSTVVDLPMWGERYSTDLYVYGNAGHTYKRTTAGVWSNDHAVPDSHGNGLKYFGEDDYLYYTSDKVIGRYGPMAGTPTWADDFLGAEAGVPTNTYCLDLELSSSQYAYVADNADVSVTGDITIETWIKLEQKASTAGNLFAIVGHWKDQSDKRSFLLSISHANDKLTLSLSDDGAGGTHKQVWESATALTTIDSWIHVAASFDISAESCKFYIDGNEEVGTETTGNSLGASLYDTDANFSVGCYYDSGGSADGFFDGKIDDVRLWNDVRSEAEIVANKSLELAGTESSLVGYWKLNNNATDSAKSSDLTLSGSPVYDTGVPFSGATGRNDLDQSNDDSGQTYTLTTAIDEGVTHRQAFVPAKDPQKSIEVNINTIGTGNWTLTVHDALNRTIATKTVAVADLNTGDFEFTFSSAWRPVLGATYHFHLTSTVADGIVVTGTANDLEDCDFHTYYQYLVDDEFHPIEKVLNKIAIGNERYLATYDGITYTFNTLTLPSGYRIRCLGKWREYLVIGATRGSTITDFDQGALFLWDGSSTTYDFHLDILEGGINAIQSGHPMRFIAGYSGDLMEYAGGKPRKILRLPKMTDKTTMEVYPGGMAMWRALTRIAVAGDSDSTTLKKGIYTFGTLNERRPETLSFDYPISTGDMTGTDVDIGMVFPMGSMLFIGWKDDTTYGVDVVKPSHSPFASATYESLITDAKKIWSEKAANFIKGYFKPLIDGDSVKLKCKIDRNASWTEGATNANKGYAAVAGEKKVRLPLPSGGNRFNEFQLGITLATTNTASPEFYGIAAAIDDLKQEERT